MEQWKWCTKFCDIRRSAQGTVTRWLRKKIVYDTKMKDMKWPVNSEHHKIKKICNV